MSQETKPRTLQTTPRSSGAARAVAALGALLVLIGIVLTAGGAWLTSLGGSPYYIIAGLGLVASGILLIRGSMAGVWLYLAVYAGTAAWAYWEVGSDVWAQVPRLFAPTVILLLVVLAALHLRKVSRPDNSGNGSAGHAGAALLIAGGFLLGGYALGGYAWPLALAQDDPPQESPRAKPMLPLEVDGNWPAYGGTYHARRYSPLDQITRS